MTPIYVWEYALHPRGNLNARSGVEPRRGALLKIGNGHGCLHPWPELGDEALDEQLKILSAGGETPLIKGAKQCAGYDAKLREMGMGIPGPRIPPSHWLVRTGDDAAFAREEGFSTAKIKGSPDLADTRAVMNSWIREGFRIRLDFNESLGRGIFLDFWNELSWDERAAIEFVEDPEEFDERGWQELREARVPIAVDRDAEARWQEGDILVMKPARPGASVEPGASFLVTTYMDHAIGQMFAAYTASVLYEGELSRGRLACGLLTHRCYEDDEFFERVRTDGSRLLPVEGTGLGFDDLLEKLPWKRLD